MSIKYGLKSVLVFAIILNVHLIIPSNGQILIGPTIGGQINRYSFGDKDQKELYQSKSNINFNAGLSFSFRANKNFFLHTSLLYSQKRKIIDGIKDPTIHNDALFRFIEMPILYTAEFKSKFGRDKVFKWYLGAGPTISYWLSGKGLLSAGDLNENIINPPDYNLSYKVVFKKDSASVGINEMNVKEPNRIQLGLNISFGVIFEPIPDQRILFNTRFNLMHSFLGREYDGEFGLPGILYYEDELQVRNQEIVFALHYFFDLKTAQRKKGKSTMKLPGNKSKK